MANAQNDRGDQKRQSPEDYYIQGKYYYQRAQVRRKAAKYRKARDDLKKSLRLNESGMDIASANAPLRADLLISSALAGLQLAELGAERFRQDIPTVISTLDQARDNIQEALLIPPDKPALANSHLAKILHRQALITQSDEDYENAIQAYNRAIEVGNGNIILDPQNGRAYKAQARRTMETASVHCQYAVKLRAAREISRALYHHSEADKKSARAISMISSPDDQKPRAKRARILAERAVTTLDAKDLELAAELAEQAYGADPDSPRVSYLCGVVMRQCKRHHWAIIYLYETLKKEPDNNDALIEMGNVYYAIGLHAEAREFYSRAADVRNPSPSVVNALAATMFKTGDVDEAIKWLLFEIDRHPDHAAAHHNLAHFYSEREEYKISLRHAEESLRLNPNSALTYMVKASAMMRLGMANLKSPSRSEPLRAMKRAHSLKPENSAIITELARCYIAHDMPREAKRLLERATTRETMQDLYMRLNIKEDTRDQYDERRSR